MDQKINLNEIPRDRKYTGYLWWSDQPKACVLENKELPSRLFESKNPFVVEGELLDEVNELSYSVRNINGTYRVSAFRLKENNDAEFCERKFVLQSHNKTILVFKEFWRKTQDPFCEGMEVLQPAEFVFCGFESKVKEGKL